MCYYVKVTFLSTLAANLSVNNIYFQIKSTVTVPSRIVNGLVRVMMFIPKLNSDVNRLCYQI